MLRKLHGRCEKKGELSNVLLAPFKLTPAQRPTTTAVQSGAPRTAASLSCQIRWVASQALRVHETSNSIISSKSSNLAVRISYDSGHGCLRRRTAATRHALLAGALPAIERGRSPVVRATGQFINVTRQRRPKLSKFRLQLFGTCLGNVELSLKIVFRLPKLLNSLRQTRMHG